MLNRKTKTLMKAVYNRAIKKSGTCLFSELEILEDIPYKLEFSREELAPTMQALANEGYIELIETQRGTEKYFCVTLLQPGYDFARQLASEKRSIKFKIVLTVLGVIASFILSRILAAIF